MTQCEATVTLIEFVRDQAPDEKRVLRALKVLEKRAEVLRLRGERRRAVVDDNIYDEPLLVTFAQFRSIFDNDVCVRCCRLKFPENAFCGPCFAKLDPRIAAAFRSGRTILFGFNRALRFWGIKPVQMEGGMVGWIHPEERPKA